MKTHEHRSQWEWSWTCMQHSRKIRYVATYRNYIDPLSEVALEIKTKLLVNKKLIKVS